MEKSQEILQGKEKKEKPRMAFFYDFGKSPCNLEKVVI